MAKNNGTLVARSEVAGMLNVSIRRDAFDDGEVFFEVRYGTRIVRFSGVVAEELAFDEYVRCVGHQTKRGICRAYP